VKKSLLDYKLVIFFLIFFCVQKTEAQLGFCQGNSGAPIFTETFGTGTTYGPPLPAGTTTYNFIGNSGPQDGEYTVGRNTFSFGWNLPSDHTGDVDGKCLIVNADFSPGEFYRTSVSGLCENTTYEFSAWLINILPTSGCGGGGGIPVNVRFEIWDITDTNLLASGSTGDITTSNTPIWRQFGLVFQSLSGQTSVILKMRNNSVGGCGNDLAIDDIVFKSCGDNIAVEDANNNSSSTICSSLIPYDSTITVIPDNSVFSSHFYQWQSSNDNINWTDINGANNATLNITNLTSATYFRAKVAEFASNLTDDDCITFSDTYFITIDQAPAAPNIQCWETATFDDTTCSWTVTGTQPPAPTGLECWETATFDTTSCSWSVSGTQPPMPTGLECWETTSFDTASCTWIISGTQPQMPNLECWEMAIFDTVSCTWIVSGTQPPMPTGLECWETATFDSTSCSWSVSGTQPTMPTGLECWETTSFDTTSCTWIISGTQPPMPTGLECWEIATFDTTSCSWSVSGTQPVEPTNLECWETTSFNTVTCAWEITGTQSIQTRQESVLLCENDNIALNPNSQIPGPVMYQWDSGEMTSSITVVNPGTYTVEVTDGCDIEHVIFDVSLIEIPRIASITSDYKSITITMENQGNYQFSLDGVSYQTSPVFLNQPIGKYRIHVRSSECDFVITQDYIHFYPIRFITPNDDGDNDFFEINILEEFESSEVYIFNRYGKLLYYAINNNISWDGTFNGLRLPTSDYWYIIRIENQEFKGHFTLKR